MRLYETRDNLAPADAVVMDLAAGDGVSLRAARWSCGRECAGTVAILPGRGEFIEKYFEVVGELLARNFDVAVLDWRGQGLSDRLLPHRRKSHIKRFRDYELDIEALCGQALESFCRPPFFALGHSMGASILLAQARAGRSPFARMVLSAPMIDIFGLRFPKGVRALARALWALGLGKSFIPGGGPNPYMTRGFKDNVLTSDPVRFRKIAATIEAAPELAVADPTIGWLDAAFRLMAKFEDVEFPRRILTPTLIVNPGADRLIDPAATEAFGSRLKVGKVITIPYARHEILIERDALREQFWAAFDAFIPGEAIRGGARLCAAADSAGEPHSPSAANPLPAP